MKVALAILILVTVSNTQLKKFLNLFLNRNQHPQTKPTLKTFAILFQLEVIQNLQKINHLKIVKVSRTT